MAPPQNLRDLPIILNLPQGMAVRVSGRVGRNRAPPPAIRSLKVAGGERALLSPLFFVFRSWSGPLLPLLVFASQMPGAFDEWAHGRR